MSEPEPRRALTHEQGQADKRTIAAAGKGGG